MQANTARFAPMPCSAGLRVGERPDWWPKSTASLPMKSGIALFGAEIARRGQRRCWSYRLCGALGAVLGLTTGLLGPRAIAAATVAIERVVLRHMDGQIACLEITDPDAVALLGNIICDEREHHDESLARLQGGPLEALILWCVSFATEAVIWLGMHRRL